MTVIKLRNKKKTRVCFLFEFIQQKDGKIGKNRIFFARWTPAIYLSRVSKPAPQANVVNLLLLLLLFSYWYFWSDTRDLLVAGVPISISWKYLYLYLFKDRDPGTDIQWKPLKRVALILLKYILVMLLLALHIILM